MNRLRRVMSATFLGVGASAPFKPVPSADSIGSVVLAPEDSQFLEELEKACFRYFWEQANPDTGLVKDRCNVHLSDNGVVASIAATGFALTATRLAYEIFNRIDWTWLSEDTSLLPHGWMPEVGFLPYRWDYYSEHMMMYLLGLGSSSHPLPVETLNA